MKIKEGDLVYCNVAFGSIRKKYCIVTVIEKSSSRYKVWGNWCSTIKKAKENILPNTWVFIEGVFIVNEPITNWKKFMEEKNEKKMCKV